MKQIIGSNFTAEGFIADGSDAIRNAFMKHFNKEKTVMCWSHMCQNVEKKLKNLKSNVTNRNEIRDDIDKL